jgi:endonuclease/exonuclease/phosphatase family metal-dependent hydrolase
LRIVSYNVHACVGSDGRFAPERIADLLAALDADFVALQEVEDRDVGGTPVSAFLARRLGMHAYPGPTLERRDADYGNLLLAKPEATAVTRHEISVPGREPRGIIEADFRAHDVTLRLFVTHLGLSGAERKKQLDLLLTVIGREGADVLVLAADFNEWAPAAGLHRKLGRHFGTSTRHKTFPAPLPVLSLDRIYVSPKQALKSSRAERSTLARNASDHLPVVCDLVPGAGSEA